MKEPSQHCMYYSVIHHIQCYVPIIHEGSVLGDMVIYILRHSQQRNKPIVFVLKVARCFRFQLLPPGHGPDWSSPSQYNAIVKKKGSCLTLFWTNPRRHSFL